MDEGTVRTALEQWRAAHPQATFDEIEDAVYGQLARLHAQWVGELAQPETGGESAETEASGGPATPRAGLRCATCGAGLRPCGRRTRQVVTRMGERATLQRRYWVCPACAAGLFPPGSGAGPGWERV
jgi:hypothetical protein